MDNGCLKSAPGDNASTDVSANLTHPGQAKPGLTSLPCIVWPTVLSLSGTYRALTRQRQDHRLHSSETRCYLARLPVPFSGKRYPILEYSLHNRWRSQVLSPFYSYGKSPARYARPHTRPVFQTGRISGIQAFSGQLDSGNRKFFAKGFDGTLDFTDDGFVFRRSQATINPLT